MIAGQPFSARHVIIFLQQLIMIWEQFFCVIWYMWNFRFDLTNIGICHSHIVINHPSFEWGWETTDTLFWHVWTTGQIWIDIIEVGRDCEQLERWKARKGIATVWSWTFKQIFWWIPSYYHVPKTQNCGWPWFNHGCVEKVSEVSWNSGGGNNIGRVGTITHEDN